MPDPVAAVGWMDDGPLLEGDDLEVWAELSDVDEVAFIIRIAEGHQILTVHLDRVHAIALAGHLASAATAAQGTLPKGHGADGSLA